MIIKQGVNRYHVRCPYCESAAMTGSFPGITFPRPDGSFHATPEETRLTCAYCKNAFSLADANWRVIAVEEKETQRV